MHPDKPIGHAVRHIVAICFAVAILAIGPLTGALAATPKAGKPAASAKSEATPEKIQELMTLLADPNVRDWLEQESKAQAIQARESDTEGNSVSHEFDSHVAAIREHIVALGAALPDLPNQIETAHSLVSEDLGSHGRVKGLLLLAVFIGLGFGVEWLFRKATRTIRRRLDEHPLETVNDRLWFVATRFTFAVGSPSRAVPHYSYRHFGGSFLVPADCRLCRLVCLRLGGVRDPYYSRALASRPPAHCLRTRPWAPCHCARGSLAPPGRAG